jgi:hypothetical protein
MGMMGRMSMGVWRGGGAVPIDTALAFLPQEFSNGTIPVALAYDANQPLGSRWSCDYDKTDWIGAGTRRYVSTSGTNAGAGGIGAPWLTMAYAVANAASGDVIEVAAGRYAPAEIPAFKDLSIIAATGARVIIADLVTEAGISAWGEPDGDGYQTVTLASGTVGGFTDLTQLRAGYPSVARQVANTTAGDVRISEGYPAHIAASSTIKAIGGRDMTDEADTNLLIWRTTAASPLTMLVGSTLYLEGITLAGHTLSVGKRLVMEACQFLGGRTSDGLIRSNSVTIISNSCIRGATTDDIMDYKGSASYVELNSLFDHTGEGTPDNCSTAHEYACGVRLGSTYEGKRPIHDIGDYPSLVVDCTSTAWDDFGDSALRTTTASSFWIQGLTLVPATGEVQIAVEGDVYLIDETRSTYTFTEVIADQAVAWATSNDYVDPVITPADPSALSPLAYYDGNDAASISVGNASNPATWADQTATDVNLTGDRNGLVTAVTVSGRGALAMANVTFLGTGVSTAVNAAQAFTMHTFVSVSTLAALTGKGLFSLGTATNGFDLRFTESGGVIAQLQVGGNTVATARVAINPGEITHVAVVCDGTSLTLYADRDQVTEGHAATLAFVDGLRVGGRYPEVSTARITGTVAEVVLFDEAQSAATVATFRQRGINLFGTRL